MPRILAWHRVALACLAAMAAAGALSQTTAPPPAAPLPTLKPQPGGRFGDLLRQPDAQVIESPNGERHTVAELKGEINRTKQKLRTARTLETPLNRLPARSISVVTSKSKAIQEVIERQRTAALLSRAQSTPIVLPPSPAERMAQSAGKLIDTWITSVNGGPVAQNYFCPGCGFDIRGNGFGTTPGKVSLLGQFPGGQPQFRVDLWTPGQIFVTLDPSLTGLVDQDNVKLVVEIPGKPPIMLGGGHFYAARDTQVLMLPKAKASFGEPSFAAPSFKQMADGWVKVRRHFVADDTFDDIEDLLPPTSDNFDGPLNGCNMSPGVDSYDLSALRPDFAVNSFEWGHGRTDSGNKDADGDRGARFFTPGYDARATDDWKKLDIAFGVFKSYYDPWWPVPDRWWCDSRYEFRITVYGPRGVSPW